MPGSPLDWHFRQCVPSINDLLAAQAGTHGDALTPPPGALHPLRSVASITAELREAVRVVVVEEGKVAHWE